LEKHNFYWPTSDQQVVDIEPKQLEWLLAGLDCAHAHERLKYLRAS
jgi:transposase